MASGSLIDLYRIGALVMIHRLWMLSEGSARLIMQGVSGVVLEGALQEAFFPKIYFTASG